MGTLRDAIIAADDLPREQVATPEWAPFGVPFVHVRGLTGKERDDWENQVTVAGPNGSRRPNPKFTNARAKFCAVVVVDADGKQEFSPEDESWLADRSAVVLERLSRKGLVLSGMIEPEEEEENPSSGDLVTTSSPESVSRSVSLTSDGSVTV